MKRAILVWHRRSGKDKTCFNFLVKEAFKRVGTYFYFLPSYTQAKKVVWDNIDNDGLKMLDHIPKELIKSTNTTELKIELVNGSIIQLIAADEFKSSGVGTNPLGVVFSEFSITDPEAWKYVSPILAANGGWAVFNFTPRGKNHAWNLLQMAKEREGWFYEVLTADQTGVFSEEALLEEKRSNSEDFFNQEYYCNFTENAGAFFKRVRTTTWSGEMEPEYDHVYQIGVDLAKYQDWTVITVVDRNTWKIARQERFQHIDWNLQKARVEAVARKYNNARIIIDSTGVGDPITEDLERQGLNVLPFKFTEASRRQLLDNLSIKLEQDQIVIPYDEGLFSELESMAFELSERGRIKVVVPSSMTDDRIMSLGLAIWDMEVPIGTYKESAEDFSMYSAQSFD